MPKGHKINTDKTSRQSRLSFPHFNSSIRQNCCLRAVWLKLSLPHRFQHTDVPNTRLTDDECHRHANRNEKSKAISQHRIASSSSSSSSIRIKCARALEAQSAHRTTPGVALETHLICCRFFFRCYSVRFPIIRLQKSEKLESISRRGASSCKQTYPRPSSHPTHEVAENIKHPRRTDRPPTMMNERKSVYLPPIFLGPPRLALIDGTHQVPAPESNFNDDSARTLGKIDLPLSCELTDDVGDD